METKKKINNYFLNKEIEKYKKIITRSTKIRNILINMETNPKMVEDLEIDILVIQIKIIKLRNGL